jgi:hypothetical protein
LGYLVGAVTVFVVGAPFLLKQEYCMRPSVGVAVLAGIAGSYLTGRLVRGRGTLKLGQIAPDMPLAVRVSGDLVASAVFVFAAWSAAGFCSGSSTLS